MIINKDIDQAGIEIMRKQICTDVYGVIQINRNHDGTRTGTFQKLSDFNKDENFQGDVMQIVKGESSS
tara:strand:+ start:4066 stop:4269 length:204 start_codon:yes stop_codon:yes gene_type:complete